MDKANYLLVRFLSNNKDMAVVCHTGRAEPLQIHVPIVTISTGIFLKIKHIIKNFCGKTLVHDLD